MDNWIVDVTGGSMTPFILGGSRINVTAKPADQIKIGDIVGFIGYKKNPVAHRVIDKKTENGKIVFKIRGDAQKQHEWVPASAITFIVTRVEHRYLSYNTDSYTGRLFTRIALEKSFKFRVIKKIMCKGFNLTLRIKAIIT
jgi:signal peptidase I